MQDEVRAEEEEKDEKKNNVEEGKDIEPAEVDAGWFARASFLVRRENEARRAQRSKRRSALFSCACWKLMISAEGA